MGDPFKEATGVSRNAGRDTMAEAMPASASVRKGAGGGSTNLSKLDGLAKDMVIEQAITDKLMLQAGVHESQQLPVETEAEDTGRASAEKELNEDGGGEEENELERIRNARRRQMKEGQKKLQEYKTLGHGAYEEIVEEDFLKTVTASERCAVHFYHKQFEKCKYLDVHMRKMAPKFMGTKFVTINAEKAHFFVAKLGIKTLPTLVMFVNGVALYKQVGFDLLGENMTTALEEFKTGRLARILKEFNGIEEDFDSDDEEMGSTK